MTPFTSGILRYGLGLAIASAVVLTGATAVQAKNAEPKAEAAAPVSPAPCFMARQHPTTTVPAVSGGVQVTITAVVAETTRVRLDKNGAVTAVGTNSGCAPKASDDFIIEKSSPTDFVIAPPAVVTAALGCRTTGSWEDTTVWHTCH